MLSADRKRSQLLQEEFTLSREFEEQEQLLASGAGKPTVCFFVVAVENSFSCTSGSKLFHDNFTSSVVVHPFLTPFWNSQDGMKLPGGANWNVLPHLAQSL